MNGICPNTGELCEKLTEAHAIRREHIDASPSEFAPGKYLGLTSEQREAYNRNMREGVQALKLLGITEQGSCVGACALAGIDIPEFLSIDPR